MKILADFRKYYDGTLRMTLEMLEEQRRKILRNIIIAGVIAGVILIGGAAFILLAVGDAQLLFIPLLIGGGVFGVAYWLLTKDFVLVFKNKVIEKIVRFFDDSLRYNPAGKVSQGQFGASQIFLHRIDRYRGEDYVSGRIGKTEIEFSEIHAEYKTVSHDSKGRRQERWHTIFRGLFFIADFNKNFNGLTVVLPDIAEKTLGKWLGQALQGMNITRQGELIKLEDPEFEKEFVVYADDQVEARYILSPALMQRITQYQRKTRKRIHISFHLSRINIAITTGKDMFEPRIFRSLLDFKMCQEYFEDLNMILGIVEDLNLNTRIWTKE